MVAQVDSARSEVDNPWEDLVVSLLSVNNRSVESTYAHISSLRKQGLFELKNLARWDHDTISKRLQAGGYDRGSFMTDLFAGDSLTGEAHRAGWNSRVPQSDLWR